MIHEKEVFPSRVPMTADRPEKARIIVHEYNSGFYVMMEWRVKAAVPWLCGRLASVSGPHSALTAALEYAALFAWSRRYKLVQAVWHKDGMRI